MLTTVSQYTKKHNMLPPGSRVLAGVSGGVDSVAMLRALCLLREEMGFALAAAHFNHGIRPESAEEEQFVGQLCASLGIELNVGRADVPAQARESGVSLEVAARLARHGFFRRTMAESDFDRLALAHHRDDQAETMLLRLFRGTGPAGLGAMAPVEGNGIVRPLLCVGREEIAAWCRQNGFEWREDASNADTEIPRNWVRHTLLPQVRERLNPRASEALCRAADLLRLDEEFLSTAAEQSLARMERRGNGSVSVNADSIEALPPAIRGRALRLLIGRTGLDRDVEQVNIDDAAALLPLGHTGRSVDLGRGFAALREADALVITPGLSEPPVWQPIALQVPGRTAAAGGVFLCDVLDRVPEGYRDFPPNVRCFDLEAFPPEACVRGRRPGDVFLPLGAPGRRKLKEYLIDRKVPRWGRDAIPLLASGDEVLWVVGHAISDRVKITEKTHRVLKITYLTGEDTI